MYAAILARSPLQKRYFSRLNKGQMKKNIDDQTQHTLKGNSAEYIGYIQQRFKIQYDIITVLFWNDYPVVSSFTHMANIPVSSSLIISIIKAQDGVSHVCNAALIKEIFFFLLY